MRYCQHSGRANHRLSLACSCSTPFGGNNTIQLAAHRAWGCRQRQSAVRLVAYLNVDGAAPLVVRDFEQRLLPIAERREDSELGVQRTNRGRQRPDPETESKLLSERTLRGQSAQHRRGELRLYECARRKHQGARQRLAWYRFLGRHRPACVCTERQPPAVGNIPNQIEPAVPMRAKVTRGSSRNRRWAKVSNAPHTCSKMFPPKRMSLSSSRSVCTKSLGNRWRPTRGCSGPPSRLRFGQNSQAGLDPIQYTCTDKAC